MALKKKNMAIVLGSTRNYFFATGTVVLNIKKFSPAFADDILIYYDDVAERDREILVQELGCKLIKYELPFKPTKNTDALRRFTPLSFSIYEIFKLLSGYRHVLWLDSDICIQDDISGILEHASPVSIRHGGAPLRIALGRHISPEMDLSPTNNTGVVLVRDDLPDYRDIHHDCYLYTQRFLETLNLPDQGIINYTLWKHGIPITDLTKDYNYTVYHAFHGYNKAKIFHLATDSKFWNHSVLRNLFPIWQDCYAQWLSLGGTAYAGEAIYPEIGDKFSIFKMLQALTPGSASPEDCA